MEICSCKTGRREEEMEISKIIESFEKIIEETYVEVKKESDTYGELESKLNNIVRNLIFVDESFGTMVRIKLEQKLKREISSLSIIENVTPIIEKRYKDREVIIKRQEE